MNCSSSFEVLTGQWDQRSRKYISQANYINNSDMEKQDVNLGSRFIILVTNMMISDSQKRPD